MHPKDYFLNPGYKLRSHFVFFFLRVYFFVFVSSRNVMTSKLEVGTVCNEGWVSHQLWEYRCMTGKTHGRMVRVERRWGSCKVRESNFQSSFGVLFQKPTSTTYMGLIKGKQTTITTTRHKRNIHLCVGDLSWFHGVFWVRFAIVCTVQSSELHLGMEEQALFEKKQQRPVRWQNQS